MKPKRRKKLLISAAALITALTLIIAVAATLLTSAEWDPDLAVHINPADIENSTLIIGSHLIYIGSLTNALYEVALTSAAESGQGSIYYKSELAGGTWFDITTASTLLDITTGGLPVGEDVIRELLMTHHTKSDGVTYDLRTGEAVSIFNIRTPYDLESMDELLPLKTHLDLAMETQAETDFGEFKIDLMLVFFQTVVENPNTMAHDIDLEALSGYHDVLKEHDGGATEMEAVQGVMEAIDAARRAEVMSIIDRALQLLMLSAQAGSGEGDDASPPDQEFMTAISDSIANISEAYLTYSAKMLAEGVSIMSEARYEVCLRLISNAQSGNHAECDVDVADIIALDNIQNSVVASKEKEIELLESPLLSRGLTRYSSAVFAGENAEYKAAVAENAASALKNGIVSQAKNGMSVLRGELEFFIDAYTERIGVLEGIDYVSGRLTVTRGWLDSIPQDGFSVAAKESVDAHIEFLSRLLSKLQAKAGGTDEDKLRMEKAALQTELLSALDNNDLLEAKELEERIDEIDDLLELLEDEDGGDIADLANELKNIAAGVISDGTGEGLDDLMEAIDALGALLDESYGTVFPVLQGLYSDMSAKRDIEDNNVFDGAIEAIEEILLENKAAYDAAMLGTLSSDDALAAADGFFGDSEVFDSGGSALSDDDQDIVLILALSMYRDAAGDYSLDGLMHARTQRQIDLGNPQVYWAIKDTSMRFLPVPGIAYMTKMRYIWSPNLNEATLARGGKYYVYTVFSAEVKTGEKNTDVQYMPLPAGYLRCVHLPEDYTLDTFGLWSVYVPGTPYGIIVNEELSELAAELLVALLRR